MAERLISPGVFTQENDLSFLPQGIAQIGAGFIGPTLKGPAFRPVIIQSQDDYTKTFGGSTTDFYTPYAIRTYLQEANTATVVRVLGLDGYDNNVVKSLLLTVTGSAGGLSGSWAVGLIHPSRTGVTLASGSIGGANKPTEFSLTLSGSNGLSTFTSMSIDPTAANYFAKILGTGPTSGKDGYAYVTFPEAAAFVSGALAGSGSMALVPATGDLMLSGSTWGVYTNARTPMIQSQLLGGQRHQLFQFFTLSDGNASNTDVKVSIASVRPNPLGSGYGTFSVIVRAFDDTDARISVLEQWDNLTMDPTSANFVARVIGTAKPVIDANGDAYLEGEWPNNSKYIYIAMADGSDVLAPEALPYGFAPLASPINDPGLVPAPSYITTRYYTPVGSTTPVANNRTYYGFNFTDETSLSYINPTPSGSIDANLDPIVVGMTLPLGVADAGFDLNTSVAAADHTDLGVASNYTLAKFTVPFQGGFDGQNPASLRNTGAAITSDNTMGFDLSDSTKDGARAYAMAIHTLSNADAWDINLLLLPGVLYSLHPYIAQLGMDLCTTRGDAFFPMDPEVLGATTDAVVNSVIGIDNNYTGVYHPWVKVLDTDSNKNVWVPPSVVMGGVYAFNDKVSAEWYAPAGLNRGGIGEALQVRTRLAQADRDQLYEGRVNPIAQFPGQGIVVWGQKTLQQQASALDRINVRRLLIEVKKFIASTSRYLVFEQNVDSTRQRFLSIVNPYLASVQERNGLYAFKVVMNDSNNTPDIIDRNILVGDLYLQPTKTAEFIVLNFNVLPTGAVFPE